MLLRTLSPLQLFGASAVGLLLIVYLVLFLLGLQETREAKMVNSVQISLQQAVSRGMTTLQLPPERIDPANIINAARGSFPKGVRVDRSFAMTLPQSPRKARFTLTHDGNLELVSLTNFTRYHIENGRIVRSTHSVLP